jgi:Tfp pilus assembly protein FimV
LTHTQNTLIRPIQLAGALAVVLLCATSTQAANINLQGLKSSFTYTPFAGESLERIIAKTMPNTELKQELVADAFRALNPQQFSKDQSGVTKSNLAINVPNQNQLANLIENQVSQTKPQNMLTGTTPAVPKVNPKTESWVRFPAKMVALTQKMENWIRYPGPNYSESTASAESKTWVRYPSVSSQNLAISTSTPVDQSEWVRYVAKN